MNIVETIKAALDDMTRSERQVASYYLGNPQDFAFCTLDAIAKKADTSTTSVLRFCRRIGFQGYKDFQQAVQAQISGQPQLPDKYRRTLDTGNALGRSVFNHIQCIEATIRDLPEAAIKQAVDLICEAERVYTFGMRESAALSHYAYTRLISVRPGVRQLCGIGDGEVETLLDMGSHDVCIVFLFHRYTRKTLKTLELLKERGVRVLLVTNPPVDEVRSLSTVLLPCQVDCGGIKNTAVAPVVLMDYFCDTVAAKLGEKALSHMKASESLFRKSEVL